jgi:hypothetical protein
MKKLILFIFAIAITGCMNMPTPPGQITAAYVSTIKYENLSCEQLSAELNSLTRQEAQLITAQEGRHKTSEMQAFWYGYGQGDGIEAAQLAIVRGEIEAVKKTMEVKGCALN